MDSSGFSSPRTDCFPAGLRVLVVDDDPTWLKILEKMLKKCNYEVTTCNLAREALNLLRERKDGFDIVISDVNMPDMDGFKLLEHVGLEMDLPVIMMSVDGETRRVMKGVQHGACDYLLKPIRMKELQNIWQHVFRKRIHEVRDIEAHESLEEIQMMRSGTEHSDDGFLFGGDLVSGKKRKDDNKHDERACGDHSSVKKARVVWTVDLHQKFVKAVNQIGFEKVGPKKILDLMGVPWLTRENVASHLQKYRLYLGRLQKDNELKAAFGGIKHSDISLREPPAGNVCLQNSITQIVNTVQQDIIADESCDVSGQKILIRNDEPKICEGNAIGILSKSRTESKKAIFGDAADLGKSNSPRISFNHPFRPLHSDMKTKPKTPVRSSWSAEIPSLHFKQEHKPDFHSEHRLNDLPMPLHQTHVDSANASLTHSPGTSRNEFDKPTQASVMPSHGNSSSQDIEKVSEIKGTAAMFSVQPESHLTDCHVIDPIPCSLWNTKNRSLVQNLFDDPYSSERNLVAGAGSTPRLWDEEFNDYSYQGGFYPPNACFGNMEMFGYINQELIAGVPPYLYDALRFDSEYPSDPVEYPVMDEGLFIA